MGLLKKLFGRKDKPGTLLEIDDLSFEQKVLASGEASLVLFYSVSCRPCQVMKGLLDELGPEYAADIKFYKINIGYNPQSVTQYQIMSTPTVVLFKKHRPVEKFSGLVPLNPLKEKLTNFVNS